MSIANQIQSDIISSCRDYLAQLELDGVANVEQNDDLLSIVDSLHLLRLIVELESQYEVKIQQSEMTEENLRTIECLSALVANKLSEDN